MKFAISVLVGLLSSAAMATPGDIGCIGIAQQGSVGLLLGYDQHGQTVPSLVQISLNNTVVFSSRTVEETMENVGTQDEPFINTVWTANDEESTATIRLPEQNEDGNTFIAILNVITDSGLFAVEDLEVTCER